MKHFLLLTLCLFSYSILTLSTATACPIDKSKYAQFYLESADGQFLAGHRLQYLLLLSQQGEGIAPFVNELKRRYLSPETDKSYKPLLLLSLYNSGVASQVEFAKKELELLASADERYKPRGCVENALLAFAVYTLGEIRQPGKATRFELLLTKLKNCIYESNPHFTVALALLSATPPGHHKEALEVVETLVRQSRDYDKFVFHFAFLDLSFFESRRNEDVQYLTSQLNSETIEASVYKEELLLALTRLSGPENSHFKNHFDLISNRLKQTHSTGILTLFSSSKANHKHQIDHAAQLLPYTYCLGETVAENLTTTAYDKDTRKEAVKFVLFSGALSLDQQRELLAKEQSNLAPEAKAFFNEILERREDIKRDQLIK